MLVLSGVCVEVVLLGQEAIPDVCHPQVEPANPSLLVPNTQDGVNNKTTQTLLRSFFHQEMHQKFSKLVTKTSISHDNRRRIEDGWQLNFWLQ